LSNPDIIVYKYSSILRVGTAGFLGLDFVILTEDNFLVPCHKIPE